MPNFTPNFNLPYPAPTDAPCDFDEQWCDFTDAVTSVLDGFQATVDRTYPVVPVAAVVRRNFEDVTTPTPIPSSESLSGFFVLPTDTVLVDTAGWIDPDLGPELIKVDIAAILTIVSAATFDTLNLNSRFLLRFIVFPVGGPLTQVQHTDLDLANHYLGLLAQGNSISFGGVFDPLFPGIFSDVLVGMTSATPELVSANTAAYWHSDRSVP